MQAQLLQSEAFGALRFVVRISGLQSFVQHISELSFVSGLPLKLNQPFMAAFAVSVEINRSYGIL